MDNTPAVVTDTTDTPTPTKCELLRNDPWFRERVADDAKILTLQQQLAMRGITAAYATVHKAYHEVRAGYEAGLDDEAVSVPVPAPAPAPEKPTVVETQTKQGDTWDIELPKTHKWTQEEMEAHYGVDTQIWECVRFSCAIWNMGAVPRAVGSSDTGWSREDGELKVHELYSSRGTWKKRKGVEPVRDVIRELVEDAKTYAPAYPKVTYPKIEEPYLLELSLPDIHFGRLCWSDETGDANYDTKIAEKIYRTAIAELMSKASHYPVERILLPIGNDLMNVDNDQNTTTGGTPQSVDGRYQRTFRKTWQILRSVIEELAAVAPVDVVCVPGNHDRMSSMAVAEVLSAWFHNSPDVTVNNEPTLRKYYPWGNTLLMFTHGSEEKKDDLGMLAMTERRDLYAKAQYVEIHLGHLHKTQMDEKFGVRWRILPSLVAADGWHAQKAFVGNIRSAEAYLWSKDRGLAATAIYNLPR